MRRERQRREGGEREIAKERRNEGGERPEAAMKRPLRRNFGWVFAKVGKIF